MTGRSAALALLVAFAWSTPAGADFVPSAAPCTAGGIAGFGVSGPAWLALCAEPTSTPRVFATALRRSPDAGATWSTIAWGDDVTASGLPRVSGVTVGPDGSFYLGTVLAVSPEGQAGRMVRVPPVGDATSVDPVAVPVPGTAGTARISPPAFDASGRPWIAYAYPQDADTTGVVLLEQDGGGGWVTAAAGSLSHPGTLFSPENVAVSFAGSGTYVRLGRRGFKLAGTALVEQQYVPRIETGGMRIDLGGVSPDDGLSYMGNPGNPPEYLPVEGSSDLIAAAESGGTQVLRRFSDVLYSPTALRFPDSSLGGTLRLVQAGDRIIAVTDEAAGKSLRGDSGHNQVAVHVGAVPSRPASTGPLSPTFTIWMTRANQLRAQAGAPPLTGDPLISLAAENHSRYIKLNPSEAGHYESPGKPGFTGNTWTDRCAAVGATCNSEDWFSGPTDAIDWWVAAPFHRPLVMSPLNSLVGGGTFENGSSVLDGVTPDPSDGRSGLLLGPVMFPIGSFDGFLEFSGETPDPGVACRAAGQPITAPYGTPTSVWIPGGTLTNFTVTPPSGQPLAGCALIGNPYSSVGVGHFVPDAGLRPHTTYVARVTWTPTAQASPRDVTWQFTTGAGSFTDDSRVESPVSKCRRKLAVGKRRVRHHKAVTVTFTTCGRSTLTASLYRVKRNGRSSARPLVTKVITIRRAKRGRLTLRTGRRGLYSVKVSLSGPSRKLVRARVRAV